MSLLTFLRGSTKSWQRPRITADTTTAGYWLNWRVLLCSIWILMSMVFASILISKFENSHNSKVSTENQEEEDNAGVLYEDEVWMPCLKSIHPGWLLIFRVFAFFVLLLMLIANAIIYGGSIFYFYTQWTLTLITIYFALGSLLSMHGCYRYINESGSNKHLDTERGSCVLNATKDKNLNQENPVRQIAGFWGYVFQVIFQMNAGAVVLTDIVFWFIIAPFLAMKDNFNFLIVTMHSINAVFLVGDTALNSLRFPWFRIGYFFLWTAVYVVFQWLVHVCISLWWPYPFLDLSSSFAPLWYLTVLLLHIPCYGVLVFIMKAKHSLLSRWFPQSYRCAQ